LPNSIGIKNEDDDDICKVKDLKHAIVEIIKAQRPGGCE
jgi:hypothetical protein